MIRRTMEQNELITREKDSEDKRKDIICLTTAGKEAVKEQKPRMDEDRRFFILSDEDQGNCADESPRRLRTQFSRIEKGHGPASRTAW